LVARRGENELAGPVAVRWGSPWRVELGPFTGVLLVLPLVVLLSVFILYPLVNVVRVSMEDGFAHYRSFFESSAHVRALLTTFRVSAIVTTLAIVGGSAVAWTLTTTTSRAARVILWTAVAAPLWMGTVVKNYIFIILLGRSGVVNTVLGGLGVIDEPLELAYTQGAVAAGMLYTMFPYAVFPLYVAFRTIDKDLLLAAEGLGASRLRSVLSIALPLSLPGIVATGTMVFLVCLGFYVTPLLLGGANSPFIATLIQDDMFVRFNVPDAAVSATLLLVAATAILVTVVLIVGRQRFERVVA
jgi:putative spermidine/putrescine transport system permease protein